MKTEQEIKDFLISIGLDPFTFHMDNETRWIRTTEPFKLSQLIKIAEFWGVEDLIVRDGNGWWEAIIEEVK